MATLRYFLNNLLLTLLVGCTADGLAPVSEAPPRSIGPELTVFPPSEKSPADVSVSTHVTIVNPQVDSSDVILSTGAPEGADIEVFSKIQEPPPLTTRQQLTAIYLSEVGTLEIGKNNHGPGPKKYLAVCNLPEGYAYCACFVKWALLESGIPTRGTAWSPSWATGPEVYYKRGTSPPLEGRSGGVQPGDVFTLYYQNLKRVGHVGFVHIWDDPRADDWTATVEGNTNGEGSREGDGVHSRRRLKRSLYTIGNFIDP